MIMPHGFRFRCNWRGKLILQRLHEWESISYPDYSPLTCTEWRDAKVQDMHEFFKIKGD